MRKQLFHVHNLSACSNVFAKFFQPQNRCSPYSIQGCAKPRFDMGIPVWKRGPVFFKSPYGNRDYPFPYGDVSIPVSIWGSPYGNVFGGQNFWWCNGAWCVTQWPTKTTVPVSIRGVPNSPLPNRVCDHMGINILSSLGLPKNSHYQRYLVPYKISVVWFYTKTTMFLWHQ